MAMDRLEKLCADKGLRMTEPRRIIARVLSSSEDHPDAEELHRRANSMDASISLATVYRTVKLFEDAGIIQAHDFRDGRARYEEVPDEHHDHLINVKSGEVVEFHSEEIERLQVEIAKKLGFKLVDHRLELYGIPLQTRLHRSLVARRSPFKSRKVFSVHTGCSVLTGLDRSVNPCRLPKISRIPDLIRLRDGNSTCFWLSSRASS